MVGNDAKEKKTKYQELEEKLALKKKSAWEQFTKEQKKETFEFCDEYKKFLDGAKTERDAVTLIENMAKDNDFKNLDTVKSAKAGMKLFDTYRGKNAALMIVGKKPITEGLRIMVSHIDSPRLDLKPYPLYEDSALAMFKTHYYGGIRKYQWVNRPLSLCGVVIRKDGTKVNIAIGERPDDPQFVISDLLPHLAKSQDDRKLKEGIKGEELNIIVGNIPVDDKKVKGKLKLAVLEYLFDAYGMCEEDFVSAELEAIPSGFSRDVGFDRSMIGGYGQDDKVCAFTSLRAVFDIKNPEYTTVILFFDKEEIGSVGNTGAQSSYLQHITGKLLNMTENDVSDLNVRQALMKSKAISADVSAAMNPTFKDVHDANNSFRLGFGVVFEKYTGYGGKYVASDANSEFAGVIRNMLNNNNVPWQAGEIGKIDVGGGGTIAMYFSKHGMDIIDMGVPVLGMHSPFEIVSKIDVYSAYLAYKAFLGL